jgi:hypothetical protein
MKKNKMQDIDKIPLETPPDPQVDIEKGDMEEQQKKMEEEQKAEEDWSKWEEERQGGPEEEE